MFIGPNKNLRVIGSYFKLEKFLRVTGSCIAPKKIRRAAGFVLVRSQLPFFLSLLCVVCHADLWAQRGAG
eukprot:6019694-Alexandrium_andersonii.AAC.1